jgi:hypothetical protein
LHIDCKNGILIEDATLDDALLYPLGKSIYPFMITIVNTKMLLLQI